MKTRDIKKIGLQSAFILFCMGEAIISNCLVLCDYIETYSIIIHYFGNSWLTLI